MGKPRESRAFCLGESPAKVEGTTVNILLYVLDSLRPDFLSCYGFDRETSPNIDSLAADGVRFKNAYSTSTWTKPSAASILTGQQPRAIKMMRWLDCMPMEVPTLQEMLAQRGFVCNAFSANGFVSHDFGLGRGFDRFVCLRFDDDLRAKGRRMVQMRDGKPAGPLPLPESQDLNEALFASGICLERNNLIFMWSLDTHNPYCVRGGRSFFGNSLNDYYRNAYDALGPRGGGLARLKSLYLDMIRHNDESIGEIVGWLKDSGAYDSSLIIVTSDHGEGLLEHRRTGHAGVTLYEEQARVPLIVKLPRFQYKGRVVEAPAQLTDILPTIADVTRCPVPARVDGLPLRTVVEGLANGRAVFCESDYNGVRYSASLRDGRWKWLRVRDAELPKRPHPIRHPQGFLTKAKRLLKARRAASGLLFDLSADPREERCLWGQMAIKRELGKRAEAIIAGLDQRSLSVVGRQRQEDEALRRTLRNLGYL